MNDEYAPKQRLWEAVMRTLVSLAVASMLSLACGALSAQTAGNILKGVNKATVLVFVLGDGARCGIGPGLLDGAYQEPFSAAGLAAGKRPGGDITIEIEIVSTREEDKKTRRGDCVSHVSFKVAIKNALLKQALGDLAESRMTRGAGAASLSDFYRDIAIVGSDPASHAETARKRIEGMAAKFIDHYNRDNG